MLVIDGSQAQINNLIFGRQSDDLIDYFRKGYERVSNFISNGYSVFKDAVDNFYNEYLSPVAVMAGRQVLNNTDNYLNNNKISYCDTYNYNPNLTMQQYIMACPEVSDLYRQGRLDGFSSTFIDTEPEVYGENRRDYNIVMDGVMQFDKDDSIFIKYYNDTQMAENDIELDPIDKFTVLKTWGNVKYMIDKGLDPTNLDDFEEIQMLDR